MSFLGALLTAFGVAPDAAAARGGIGRCPRCATPLCLSAGALHDDICADCQGRYIDDAGATLLIESIQGIAHDERLTMSRRGPMDAGTCPRCEAGLSHGEIDGIAVRMVHRHVAWMDALRHQLRRLKSWEHQDKQAERARNWVTPPERKEDLREVLAPLSSKVHSAKWKEQVMETLQVRIRGE